MSAQPPIGHSRAAQAAERVLVDLGQVLASYMDKMVLVGGLSPGLLFSDADPSHSGSIDVDIALQADSLANGGCAQLLETLLNTNRYCLSDDSNKRFRLMARVDLKDGKPEVNVPVDFLAPPGVRFKKDPDIRLRNFRVLQADGCGMAFLAPKTYKLEDRPNLEGALNNVSWRVIAVENLLVMKSFALAGREKKKDAYDIVFCLDQLNQRDELDSIASVWRKRSQEKDIQMARETLAEKFKTPKHVGSQWYADFLADGQPQLHARLAHELVRKFLASSSE